MATSWTDFRESLRTGLLDLLWKEWSAIGVPGRNVASARSVVDPEALLLLTMTVGRHDPRLFDEVACWLRIHSDILNVQRLRNLIDTYGYEGASALVALVERKEKSPLDLKWRRVVETFRKRAGEATPEPFFFLPDGSPMPAGPEKSPEFHRLGFLRSPLRIRDHFLPFPATGTPTLLLRLRALLGVTIRCELLCFLGASDEIHPSGIARAAGCMKRTAQVTLAEMAASGMIQVRPATREKFYSIQKEGPLTALLCPEGVPTPWRMNAPMFRALEIVWLSANDPRRRAIGDPQLAASEYRRLIGETRSLFGEAGYGHRVGEERSDQFPEDVLEILSSLAG